MMNKKETNIYLADTLINAIHDQKFTELELKIMHFVLDQITKNDMKLFRIGSSKLVTIQSSYLNTDSDLSHFSNDELINKFKNLAIVLQNKTMMAELNEEKGPVKAVIITTFRYQDGVIMLHVHHLVLPYLIAIKEQYSQCYFEDMIAKAKI